MALLWLPRIWSKAGLCVVRFVTGWSKHDCLHLLFRHAYVFSQDHEVKGITGSEPGL